MSSAHGRFSDGDKAARNDDYAIGDGDGRAAGGGTESSGLAARVEELSKQLEEVQAKVVLNSSVRTGPPRPFDILRDSDVLAVVWMPIMYLCVVLGWALLPLGLLGLAGMALWGHLLLPLLPWAAGACIVGAMVVAFLGTAPFLERFRRRMLVYGVAVVVLCDYRIVRVRVARLDSEEADLAWERAHQR